MCVLFFYSEATDSMLNLEADNRYRTHKEITRHEPPSCLTNSPLYFNAEKRGRGNMDKESVEARWYWHMYEDFCPSKWIGSTLTCLALTIDFPEPFSPSFSPRVILLSFVFSWTGSRHFLPLWMRGLRRQMLLVGTCPGVTIYCISAYFLCPFLPAFISSRHAINLLLCCSSLLQGFDFSSWPCWESSPRFIFAALLLCIAGAVIWRSPRITMTTS